MSQRDTFIQVLHEAARHDKNIVLISCDFGAPALDDYRLELPAQFIHGGISEQAAVNIATGLALEGKKVFCYWMSPFWPRCFEQMKMVALMNLPVTFVSVGGGLGYAGAGPTHYALEDIAMFRTIGPLWLCSDDTMAAQMATESLAYPGPLAIRLERHEADYQQRVKMTDGYRVIEGKGNTIVTYGYLVEYFRKKGHKVIDVFKLPITPLCAMELAQYDTVYTFEEQYLPGGFGAAIIEALHDNGKKTRVFRRGVPQKALIENGKRDEILAGLWE